jgi:hypothetical protein
MPQTHHLVPPRGAALLALLPVAVIAATVLAMAHPAPVRSEPRGAGGATRVTRHTDSHAAAPVLQPAAAASKSAAPAPAAADAGAYQYPLDAMGQVAEGRLVLGPITSGSAGAGSLKVEISPAGWVPGQKVFLFLGRRFLLASSPGASVVVDAAGSAGATLSGFQFPSDNPAAPVDGYASASVPGTVG